MIQSDVIVVGGGPAGSTCARRLRQAGLDVLVLDRAVFPRDKVCAGWITPAVIQAAAVDLDEYRRGGRTLQPITGFRTGLIGRERHVDTRYRHPVSFGIRRYEFDHYLLERSGARLELGTALTTLRRDGGRWIVNERLSAPMLVGAGGHFCPVSRHVNRSTTGAPIVVAQETEFPIENPAAWATEAETPELYFCADLKGYGWCFRKGQHLNVGLGRLDQRSLPAATAQFIAFLRARGRIPDGMSWQWRGHAYLVSAPTHRRVVDDGVLLVGDAAGLAYPSSGEGIRPAVESGAMAADTIVSARGVFTSESLQPYARQLRDRFGRDRPLREAPAWLSGVAAAVAPWLFGVKWFVRHRVLNRAFLGAY